jgi:gluconolactonase
MPKQILLFFSFFILASSQKSKPNEINERENQTSTSLSIGEVEKLATGFAFTEGPAADSDGNVYFTDIPNDQILIWKSEEKLDTFQLRSVGANVLYFNNNDELLVCEGGRGRITVYQKDEEYKVITSNYNGKRFNQPNDFWPDLKGGIYFSDPKYADIPKLPQDGEYVYYIKPDFGVVRITPDLKKPNGIIGTPDNETRFITDTELDKTFQYTFQPNGNLSDKELFINLGSDGMTLDKKCRLYLTTISNNQVEVYSPKAQKITVVEVPEKPSNVCFAGKRNDELYITVRTSLYRIKTNTQGVN